MIKDTDSTIEQTMQFIIKTSDLSITECPFETQYIRKIKITIVVKFAGLPQSKLNTGLTQNFDNCHSLNISDNITCQY